ncbi:MAG: DUF2905 domain-containing protein [Burkholderiales bacterium]|nr:DUF2905 domain-containing protein [Anaerolineae bacterium]
MDIGSIGRILLIAGVVVAVIGGALLLLARIPLFGNLPGDIRIEGQGFSCFVPIASMIVLSIILTVVLNFVVRFINRQ